jgi:hypothetical protein
MTENEEIEELMAWLRQQAVEQGIDIDFGDKPSYISPYVVSVPVSTRKIKGSVGKKVNLLTRLEENWYKTHSAPGKKRRLLLVPQS